MFAQGERSDESLYCGFDFVRDAVIAASWSCGVCMYCRNAAIESSIPAIAVVVAAPVRKLCPADCSSGYPAG